MRPAAPEKKKQIKIPKIDSRRYESCLPISGGGFCHTIIAHAVAPGIPGRLEPFTSAVCYSPPCRFSSCPAYEPNSNEGEYSQPFRHIQYNRIAILRPIATLAMLLCRRIARRMYRRRQCGL